MSVSMALYTIQRYEKYIDTLRSSHIFSNNLFIGTIESYDWQDNKVQISDIYHNKDSSRNLFKVSGGIQNNIKLNYNSIGSYFKPQASATDL